MKRHGSFPELHSSWLLNEPDKLSSGNFVKNELGSPSESLG